MHFKSRNSSSLLVHFRRSVHKEAQTILFPGYNTVCKVLAIVFCLFVVFWDGVVLHFHFFPPVNPFVTPTLLMR